MASQPVLRKVIVRALGLLTLRTVTVTVKRLRSAFLLLAASLAALALIGTGDATALSKKADPDRDGMPSGWEKRYRLNPNVKDGRRDLDHDGLSNKKEFKAKTNPRRADTDRDGMPDGWEVRNGTNPRKNDANKDYDNDGLTNIEEYEGGTKPRKADSDDDYDIGYEDGCDDALFDSSLKLYGPAPNDNDPAYVEGYNDGYADCYGSEDEEPPFPEGDPAVGEDF